VLVTSERLQSASHMHHQLMRVCIILHAFHTYIHCKYHHPCIMVYASFGQHHDNCIVSYAPFQSCMESSILVLHHHCNHTLQRCITFMVIYRALYSEYSILSLFLNCIGINRLVLQSTSSSSFRQ
jgi:hypothetical protein